MFKRFFPLCIIGFLIPAVSLAEVPISAVKLSTSGLSRPLFLTSAPGDPNRIYIVEQGSGTTANIRIFDFTTGLLGTPFLTVSGVETAGDEQGLLGLAFHPNYATTDPYLYVNLTVDGSGATEVRRYTKLNSSAADPGSGTIVLGFSQPQSNHNGGWMGFRPTDGYLYIASGDGGNFNDQGDGHIEPAGNAQNTGNLLGKMLRIDVNSDAFPGDADRNYANPTGNPFIGQTGEDEIFHYGLRNPWRASFDRQTGDLYIGDVGQSTKEEISFQAATGPGGLNFGWRVFEGDDSTTFGGPLNGTHTPPIYDYPRSDGGTVIGGYVYRGSENPALEGTYFFADFLTGRIWSFKYDGQTISKFRNLTGQIDDGPDNINATFNITSFGEDAQGRLYLIHRNGDIYRLTPAIPGDANQDDKVDIRDLRELLDHWMQPSGALWADADFTDDGIVDRGDLALLARYWQVGVGGSPAPLLSELESFGLPTDVVPEPISILVAGMLMGAGACLRCRAAHQG